MPLRPPITPDAAAMVEMARTSQRYQPRMRWAGGKSLHRQCDQQARPAAACSAFITCTPTFSETRSGQTPRPARRTRRTAHRRRRTSAPRSGRCSSDAAVAGDLAQAPGEGQRDDDRGDHRRRPARRGRTPGCRSVVPRNGVSAWPISPTVDRLASGSPRPIVAAQAISTAAMTSCVSTAPIAVSQRAAAQMLAAAAVYRRWPTAGRTSSTA